MSETEKSGAAASRETADKVRWWTAARRVSSSMLDLAFPPSCVCCGEQLDPVDDRLLCLVCRVRLLPQGGVSCRRCAAPVAEVDAGKDDCPHCRGTRFRFDSATALGSYSGPLGEAVLRMKHVQGELLALALGRVLAERFGTKNMRPDVIVPMPMHWTRRLLRGTNNPEVLAEPISRHLRVPLATCLLRFHRKVKQQSTLAASTRRENVRGALAVSPGYALAGKKILLVDDILTTGATANEAARVLKQAGAETVAVAVVARGTGLD